MKFSTQSCQAQQIAIALRLEIPVEPFIRIRFWRVWRKIMQFDLIFPLIHPLPDLFGMMDPQVVHNQEYLVLRVVEQALQEIDEALGIDRTIMHTKPHQTLIGYSRNHRDAIPARRVQ